MTRVYNSTAKYVSVIRKNKKILRVLIWKPKVKSDYIPPNVPIYNRRKRVTKIFLPFLFSGIFCFKYSDFFMDYL